VHLYAPALGLGLAALLAMPGQLGLALLAEGQRFAGLHAGLLGVPLVIAGAVRVAAPRVYTLGFFEAVAWLAEATRSLAGPPEPPPRPAWVARVASPGDAAAGDAVAAADGGAAAALDAAAGVGAGVLVCCGRRRRAGRRSRSGSGWRRCGWRRCRRWRGSGGANAALLAGLPLPAGANGRVGSAGLTLAIAGVPAGAAGGGSAARALAGAVTSCLKGQV
jgi:hypothetical protein